MVQILNQVTVCVTVLTLEVLLNAAARTTVGLATGPSPIKPPANCSCSDGKDGPKGPPGPRGPPGPPGPRGSDGSGSGVVSGTAYTRWGNSTCANGKDVDTVYSGIVVGRFYHRIFGLVFSSEPMCLQNVYEAEVNRLDQNEDQLRVLPCAVCYAKGRSTSLVIPGQGVCPPGWSDEYHGYILSSMSKSKPLATYLCVDTHRLQESEYEELGLYAVELDNQLGVCNGYQCRDKQVECVVCSK